MTKTDKLPAAYVIIIIQLLNLYTRITEAIYNAWADIITPIIISSSSGITRTIAKIIFSI